MKVKQLSVASRGGHGLSEKIVSLKRLQTESFFQKHQIIDSQLLISPALADLSVAFFLATI